MATGKMARRMGMFLAVLVLVIACRAGAQSKEFSIVVLPDPQNYASDHPVIGKAQAEWIKDNVEKLQIKFACTVGDNVNLGVSEPQWKNSLSFMDKLEGVLPYGMATGNHDHKDGKKNGFSSTRFVDIYGPKRFKKYDWYGGASDSGFSSYQFFTGAGKKFVALELDVAATDAEIAWAKKVLSANAKLPAILITHQMLNPAGVITKEPAVPGPNRNGGHDIFEKLVKPSTNVFLVLCGHYHGEARKTIAEGDGTPVHIVLQDYQQEKNGGNGWLRIFTFQPEKNSIHVQTWSPSLKEYKKDKESEFNLDLNFKKLGDGK